MESEYLISVSSVEAQLLNTQLSYCPFWFSFLTQLFLFALESCIVNIEHFFFFFLKCHLFPHRASVEEPSVTVTEPSPVPKILVEEPAVKQSEVNTTQHNP